MSKTLRDAVIKAWTLDPVLRTIPGPFPDGWKDRMATAWWRIVELDAGGGMTRFIPKSTDTKKAYIDREPLMLQAFVQTREKADILALAMKNRLADKRIQPSAGGGFTLSCQQVGVIAVRHFNKTGSKSGDDGGLLNDCWMAAGTWIFVLQRTLGVN